MTTPKIEEILQEFKNLPHSDDTYGCMECGGGIDEVHATEWLEKLLTSRDTYWKEKVVELHKKWEGMADSQLLMELDNLK